MDLNPAALGVVIDHDTADENGFTLHALDGLGKGLASGRLQLYLQIDVAAGIGHLVSVEEERFVLGYQPGGKIPLRTDAGHSRQLARNIRENLLAVHQRTFFAEHVHQSHKHPPKE